MNMDLTGLGSLFDFGKAILERVVPDPAQRLQATQKLAELAQAKELAQLASDTDLLKGQLDINKEEAKSASRFVAWWRPAVGWVCVIGLLVQYLIFPLVGLFGVKLPIVDFATLLGLLIPMLGIASLRTYEKRTGTEGNR